MESILAAAFIALTAGEVIAKFAGSISAVHHKLRTDCTIPISIPHNAGT